MSLFVLRGRDGAPIVAFGVPTGARAVAVRADAKAHPHGHLVELEVEIRVPASDVARTIEHLVELDAPHGLKVIDLVALNTDPRSTLTVKNGPSPIQPNTVISGAGALHFHISQSPGAIAQMLIASLKCLAPSPTRGA